MGIIPEYVNMIINQVCWIMVSEKADILMRDDLNFKGNKSLKMRVNEFLANNNFISLKKM